MKGLCPLFLSCMLMLGCSSKILTPVYTGMGAGISSLTPCSQGPFQYSFAVPKAPYGSVFQIAFLGVDPGIDLLYQVKLSQSERVLASGVLTKEAKIQLGGVPVKNPCVGRQMPRLGQEEETELVEKNVLHPSNSKTKPPAVRIQSPLQKIPEGTPLVEIPLDAIPENTLLTFVFWTEKPYPFETASIQVRPLFIEKQKHPDILAKQEKRKEERGAKKREKKTKRAEKRAKALLGRESRKFSQLKIYAKQQKEQIASSSSEQERKRLESDLGKQLWEYFDHFELIVARKSIAYVGNEPVFQTLHPKIKAFIQEHQKFIDLYWYWRYEKEKQKKEQIAKRKQERKEKRKTKKQERKLAKAKNEFTRQARAFQRIIRRDNRLQTKILTLPAHDTETQFFLEAKRGKHLRQFFPKGLHRAYNRRTRGFGSIEKQWTELLADVGKFIQTKNVQLRAYNDWKKLKRKEKRERIAERKKERKLAKAYRQTRRAESLLLRESKRFQHIVQKDKRLVQKQTQETQDTSQWQMLERKRGKRVKQYQKQYRKMLSSRYSRTFRSMFKKQLAKTIDLFLQERQPQIVAYTQWERQKKQERKRLIAKRKQEKKQRKKERINTRVEQLFAREMKKLRRLEAQDTRLQKQQLGLENTEAYLSLEIKRGELIQGYLDYYKDKLTQGRRFRRKVRFALLQKLNPFVVQFRKTKSVQLEKYAIWQQQQKEKKQEQKQAKALVKLERIGGALREAKRWKRFLEKDKILTDKIASLGSDRQTQRLLKRRLARLEKRILALFEAYDRTSPEGRLRLSGAYRQALLFQNKTKIVVLNTQTPPPPPLLENQGNAPMVGAIWRAGYWKMEQNEWLWVAGFWELPPGAVPPTINSNVLVPQK